ncbi:protein Emp47p [Trichomonascus vanleenenianus]|uniref:protein Emp47p n=1 Tax=Trichomonascus vanleenenianus TaxID=2268995 RepID=UPI003ECB2E50
MLAHLASAASLDTQLSLPDNFGSALPADWNYQGYTKFENSRAMLTPLDQGLQHGSLWTKSRNSHQEWTLDVQMSVAGPVSPGGSLALWYSANPNEPGPVHGSRDQWDGLAIMLDSSGEDEQGTLRGHLNDGSVSYQSFAKPIEKAFSLCKINYRNTGALFSIRVGYGKGSLVVDVNGQKCFETDKVVLPPNLYFGASAMSTENPDSFVVHKLKVYDGLLPEMERHVPQLQKLQEQQQQQQQVQQQQQQQQVQQKNQPRQEQQGGQPVYHQEILEKLGMTHDKLVNVDKEHSQVRAQLEAVENKMARLESLLQSFMESHSTQQKSHISDEMNQLKSQLDDISKTVSEHTTNIIGSLPETVNRAIQNGGPSIWILFVLVIAIQGILIVGYNVYKTRRSYHAKIL